MMFWSFFFCLLIKKYNERKSFYEFYSALKLQCILSQKPIHIWKIIVCIRVWNTYFVHIIFADPLQLPYELPGVA